MSFTVRRVFHRLLTQQVSWVGYRLLTHRPLIQLALDVLPGQKCTLVPVHAPSWRTKKPRKISLRQRKTHSEHSSKPLGIKQKKKPAPFLDWHWRTRNSDWPMNSLESQLNCSRVKVFLDLDMVALMRPTNRTENNWLELLVPSSTKILAWMCLPNWTTKPKPKLLFLLEFSPWSWRRAWISCLWEKLKVTSQEVKPRNSLTKVSHPGPSSLVTSISALFPVFLLPLELHLPQLWSSTQLLNSFGFKPQELPTSYPRSTLLLVWLAHLLQEISSNVLALITKS